MDGHVNTVSAGVFTRTYQPVGPTISVKHTIVWAEAAACDRDMRTRQGRTPYRHGDYRVWNDEGGTDSYVIANKKFTWLYLPKSLAETSLSARFRRTAGCYTSAVKKFIWINGFPFDALKPCHHGLQSKEGSLF